MDNHVLVDALVEHTRFLSTTFNLESKTISERGKTSSEKVWTNFNGSGVMAKGIGEQGSKEADSRSVGYVLNRKLEELPSNCTLEEAKQAMIQGFTDAKNALEESRVKRGGNLDVIVDAVKICMSESSNGRILLVGHVGNNRTTVFRSSSNTMEIVTKDHTIAARLKEIGQEYEEDSKKQLYRSVGSLDSKNIARGIDFVTVELDSGDIVLILSVGINESVPPKAIERIIIKSPESLKKLRTENWPSGLAGHLTEVAHGVNPQKDVSAMILAPHFSSSGTEKSPGKESNIVASAEKEWSIIDFHGQQWTYKHEDRNNPVANAWASFSWPDTSMSANCPNEPNLQKLISTRYLAEVFKFGGTEALHHIGYDVQYQAFTSQGVKTLKHEGPAVVLVEKLSEKRSAIKIVGCFSNERGAIPRSNATFITFSFTGKETAAKLLKIFQENNWQKNSQTIVDMLKVGIKSDKDFIRQLETTGLYKEIDIRGIYYPKS